LYIFVAGISQVPAMKNAEKCIIPMSGELGGGNIEGLVRTRPPLAGTKSSRRRQLRREKIVCDHGFDQFCLDRATWSVKRCSITSSACVSNVDGTPLTRCFAVSGRR
jgi:hypothetical protein